MELSLWGCRVVGSQVELVRPQVGLARTIRSYKGHTHFVVPLAARGLGVSIVATTCTHCAPRQAES